MTHTKREAHTPGPCKCRVKPLEHTKWNVIEYCPLHAAAPELLRVAKEIVAAYSFVASTTVDTLIEDDLQAAIAKAESTP